MDILIISIIAFVVLVIIPTLFMYFILREPKNVEISKNIVFKFAHERKDAICNDDLDEFVKFHKAHDFKKYEI